ncbi:MAG: hypothetical protein AAB649_04145 [Patescibacteria group bacterium]
MSDSTKPDDATSYKETAFGIIPRDELIVKEAEGIARGIEYIISLSNKSFINSDVLLGLHKVCFGWIFPDWAGKYRAINVQTSTHTFPDYSDVRILVKDFLDDLNERLRTDFDSVELIAWAHHRIYEYIRSKTITAELRDYSVTILCYFLAYLFLKFRLNPKKREGSMFLR